MPTTPKAGLSSAQITVLKQQGFEWTGNGWAFGMGDKLLFDTDKDQLRSNIRGVVEKIGQVLVTAGIQRVRVEGHTDSVGSESYNAQLSLRRASAVADALVSGGMNRANIVVQGLGQRDPVADNKTVEGRKENRRVAIIVSTQ
jgi:outer membrane protein OmpA-like peptidoglycan-associated protein